MYLYIYVCVYVCVCVCMCVCVCVRARAPVGMYKIFMPNEMFNCLVNFYLKNTPTYYVFKILSFKYLKCYYQNLNINFYIKEYYWKQGEAINSHDGKVGQPRTKCPI